MFREPAAGVSRRQRGFEWTCEGGAKGKPSMRRRVNLYRYKKARVLARMSGRLCRQSGWYRRSSRLLSLLFKGQRSFLLHGNKKKNEINERKSLLSETSLGFHYEIYPEYSRANRNGQNRSLLPRCEIQ